MRGDTLVSLVVAMEAHPDVGLIQTLPIITGGTTLFARMQQFAGRVYGPVIAHGIAWWHGAEGNYWGHNALIRTVAFAEQAGLPELRGRKPFGGHIMSHDFIEAALMRRGGWAIHMMPGLEGSYEESPPSLMDLAVRDRRWCQGNLQHMAVLPARGLHWVSRMHLLTGIGSYITAPLWLLFLLSGILIALQARFIPPDYFPGAGKALFPQWPVIDPVRAMWVFIGTMGLLLVPKLLGMITVMVRREPAARLRRVPGPDRQPAAGDPDCRPDGAGGDADAVDRRRGDPAGTRFRLERAAAGRWRDPVARHHPPVSAPYHPGRAAGDRRLGGFAVPRAVDAAGRAGAGAGGAAGILTGRRSLGMGLRRIGLLRIPEEGPSARGAATGGHRCIGRRSAEPTSDSVSVLLPIRHFLAVAPADAAACAPAWDRPVERAAADRLGEAGGGQLPGRGVADAKPLTEKAAVLSDGKALERLVALRRANPGLLGFPT